MSVSQYLQHYAEKDIELADFFCQLNAFHYQHVLTIPVFNEPLSLVTKIKQLNTTESVIVILILNTPNDVNDPEKINNTQKLSVEFKRHYKNLSTLSAFAHLLELDQQQQQHLLLIEHCQEGRYLPPAEGVGLARKIVCDLACEFIHRKRIKSDWIHITDADVSLPNNYFSATEKLSSTQDAAAIYPFQHLNRNSTPQLQQAQQLYDISLDYYLEGLHWANSPYAFHTIGSTLLVNYQAYAKVRGFPKRAAGEDFYLLNKLAKIGNIISLKEPVLEISVRESDRVPFGTGPALTKILQLEKPYNQYLFYHPQCFIYLQQWLFMLPTLWLQKNTKLSLTEIIINSDCVDSLTIDLTLLVNCLVSLKTEKALRHAYQHSKSEGVFLAHMNNWFDAFKTLKFIHFLRNESFPSVNAKTLSADCSFISEKIKNQLA